MLSVSENVKPQRPGYALRTMGSMAVIIGLVLLLLQVFGNAGASLFPIGLALVGFCALVIGYLQKIAAK